MKKRSLLVVLAMVMTVLLMSACSKTEYTLNLPAEPTSITLTKDDDDRTIMTAENIQTVLTMLKGSGRITTDESTQDSPSGTTDEIKIDFAHNPEGTSTLFVYKKADKFYIEQPYNGIYEITAEEYDSLSKFYDGLKVELGELADFSIKKRVDKLKVVDQMGKSFKTSELTNDEVLRLGYCLFGPTQNFGFISTTFEDLQRTYLNGWFGRSDCTPKDITCFCGEVISKYNPANDEFTWDDNFHYLDHSAKSYDEIIEMYQIEDRYVVKLYKIFPDIMMNSNPSQFNFYPTYNDAVNKTNVLFTVTNEDEFENAVKSLDDSKKTSYTMTFKLVKGSYKLVEYKIND
ncbi:MAG: DUF5301 domain-containing protein [Clostridia bacterium]|nr:DUF5301 domain-containing protein [Clostridia bacterium]